MNRLEISILIVDKKIFDLENEDLDKYEKDFTEEFEKSPIGKALLKQGYKQVDRDFDDCTLQVTYRKK